jgi:integrase
MIPLTENAYEIIKELKERYPNETEPFRRYTSSQVARCFRRMREHLGFKDDKEYVLHSIRHTVATKLLAQGNDIFKVAEWCGHSNLETTRRYLKMIHVFREDFAESMIDINKR